MAAPFVLEFDADRQARVQLRRSRARARSWPQSPGSLAVDAKGNVWVTGAGLEPAPPPPPGAPAAVAAVPLPRRRRR